MFLLTDRQTRTACALAVLICFGLVFGTFFILSGDEDDSGPGKDGVDDFHVLYTELGPEMDTSAASIRENQSDGGGWERPDKYGDGERIGPPGTTAVSALALLEYGMNTTSVYHNDNGTNVSIANDTVSSAADVILDYGSFNDSFQPDGYDSVNSLGFVLQAAYLLSPGSAEQENYTLLLIDSQQENGSWANNSVVTARALESLSPTGGLDRTIYDPAAAFLADSGAGTDIVIGMSAGMRAGLVDDDAALLTALEELIRMQRPDGSFNLSMGPPGGARGNGSSGPPPGSPGPADMREEYTLRAIHAISISYRYYFSYDRYSHNHTGLADRAVDALEASLEFLLGNTPGYLEGDYGKALRLYEMALARHVIGSWHYREEIGDYTLSGSWTQEDFPFPAAGDGAGGAKDNDDEGDALAPGQAFGSVPGIFVPFVFSILLSMISVYLIILYARIGRKNAFDGIRKDIYEYIGENPGEHFSAIMRHFEISPSSATHHLQVLEYLGFVSAYRYEKYKRFYLKNHPPGPGVAGSRGMPPAEKRLISLLRNRTCRRFVEYVRDHPHANQKEISTVLGIHPSTVNWHARRLVRSEVLSQLRQGKDVFYRVRDGNMVGKVLSRMEDEV